MRVVKLGSVCTKIGSGATPRGGSDVYLPRGTALIRSQNIYNDGFHAEGLAFINEEHAAQLAGVEVEAGDVLLNITGDSVARSCRAPEGVLPARVNQHVAIIRPDPDELDPGYLHFHLISPAKQAEMLSLASAGATRNALTKGMIENFDVPAPSLAEQRAIASVLGALDDKIEQNRRTAQALEKLARAIFRAWFVDFEPVKAKAAGATSFPSMPQPVFDALPTTFVDSDIGPVPEGWEIKQLRDVCHVNVRSLRAGEIEGEIEYVSISSVTRGHLDTIERMDFVDAPSRARRQIKDGDTIWSCVRPNRMSYLYIHEPPENRIVSTGFAVLSPTDIGPSFLYQLTTQPEFVDYLVANATGSAYPAVRGDHFEATPVVCAPSIVLGAFEAATYPMREWIGTAESESRKLAETRDYLLPKLLSGTVRVTHPNPETIA